MLAAGLWPNSNKKQFDENTTFPGIVGVSKWNGFHISGMSTDRKSYEYSNPPSGSQKPGGWVRRLVLAFGLNSPLQLFPVGRRQPQELQAKANIRSVVDDLGMN